MWVVHLTVQLKPVLLQGQLHGWELSTWKADRGSARIFECWRGQRPQPLALFKDPLCVCSNISVLHKSFLNTKIGHQ